MISLLIALIVFGLIWYLVSTLPLPSQVKMVINVVFILILIVYVLRFAGIWI